MIDGMICSYCGQTILSLSSHACPCFKVTNNNANMRVDIPCEKCKELQSRIDKAIEFLNNCRSLTPVAQEDVIDILKGADE